MNNQANLPLYSCVPVWAAAGLLIFGGCGDDASATTETDGGMSESASMSSTASGTTGAGEDTGSTTESETAGSSSGTNPTASTESTGSTGTTGSEGGETEGSTGETGGEGVELVVDFPPGRSTSVENAITVRGHVTSHDAADVLVRVAGMDVELDSEGVFSIELPLGDGSNTVTAELLDAVSEMQLDVVEREVVRQLLLVEPRAIASGPGHDVVYLADAVHGIVAANKLTGRREVLATPDTTSAVLLAYDDVGNRLVLVDRILDTLQLIDPDNGSVTTLLADIPGNQISWARMDAPRNRIFLGYGSSTPPIVVDLDSGASQTFAPGAPWSGHWTVGIDSVNNRTFARGFDDWLLIDFDDASSQNIPADDWLGGYTAGFVDPAGAAGYRVRTAGSPVVRRVDFATWEETGSGSFPSAADLVGPTADAEGLVAAMVGLSPFESEVDVLRVPWDGTAPQTLTTNRFPQDLADDCSGGEVAAAENVLLSLCFGGDLRAVDLDEGTVTTIEPPDWGSRIEELGYDAERQLVLALFSDPGGSAEFEGLGRYSLSDGTWEQHIATSAARSGSFDFDPVSDAIVISSSYSTGTAVLFDAESGNTTQVLNLIDGGVSSIAIDDDAIYYVPTAAAFVNRFDRAAGTLSQLIAAGETPAGGTPFGLMVDEGENRLLASTSAGRLIAIDRTTGVATSLLQGGELEPHETDALLDIGAYLGDFTWMPEAKNFVVEHRGRLVLHDLVTGDAVTLTR